MHIKIEERTYPLRVRAFQLSKPPEKSENYLQLLARQRTLHLCWKSLLKLLFGSQIMFGRVKVALKYDIRIVFIKEGFVESYYFDLFIRWRSVKRCRAVSVSTIVLHRTNSWLLKSIFITLNSIKIVWNMDRPLYSNCIRF